MSDPLRVLVLGGTGEARSLCAALARMPGIAATASLAGVTETPARYGVPTRSGGFGGVEGLARYLDEERIDALVDATHPLAECIARNAAAATRRMGVRHLKLLRPAWRPGPGERWREVPDFPSAAHALPPGARVFLATGPGSAPHFRDFAGTSFVLRVIDPRGGRGCPEAWTILTARPPFTVESERATFAAQRITHLVARNAGGAEGRTKLDAAAALGLEVVMIARLAPPPGIPSVGTAAEALDWLRDAGPYGLNPA